MSNDSFKIQPFRRKWLNDYYSRMSKDQDGKIFDDRVARVLLEQGFSPTEDPRSVYKVEKLFEWLNKYSPDRAVRIDTYSDALRAGISLAYACFAKPEETDVLPISDFCPEHISSITSNLKASAGLTAWGQTKAESMIRAYERGIQTIMGIKKPEPCIAFKRTQSNEKTRLVWGYPYTMTAIEGLFARPLIDEYKKGNTPMAFGMSTGLLGTKLRVSSYRRKFAYSTDVSSFDSSISADLIDVAFKIISTWFNLEEFENTTGAPYRLIFDIVKKYFITTPIVMPDGNIYVGKRHGVPSGSYFTQIVDSIVNVIVVGAISHEFNLGVNQEDILVLGDDVLFWSNRDVSLDHLAKYATRVFKMTFNPSKCGKFYYKDKIKFLGRVWECGVPDLDEEQILAKMVSPERFRKYEKDRRKAEQQVHLLLLSYACVYKTAFKIFIRCQGRIQRYHVSLVSIEKAIARKTYDFRPDMMTGLERFKMIYGGSSSTSGESPIALQFWK